MDKKDFWDSVLKAWTMQVPRMDTVQPEDRLASMEAKTLSRSIADILKEPED